MKTLKILGVCGSLRRQSTNLGLLKYAQSNAPTGTSIHIADLSHVPFYNADISEKPAAVVTLLDDFARADALLFACPEYNYSLAPALKNALDWASREENNRLLSGKAAAIIGSGGALGTARAQYHLRQVCVSLNLHLLNKPEIYCHANSGEFDAQGELVDGTIQQRIQQLLLALQDLALRFS